MPGSPFLATSPDSPLGPLRPEMKVKFDVLAADGGIVIEIALILEVGYSFICD